MLNKVLGKISQTLNYLLAVPVCAYRYLISPLLGDRCRFHPSCSCYAQEALKKRNTLIALWLIMKRLLKCHPWHPGGYDPVPEKHKSKS